MAAPALSGPAPARYDDESIAALYATHAADVLRHCRRELRGRPEAEDAVQTTFLHAIRALRRGVVPDSEAAWLHTIATNVCHTQRRSTAVRNRHTADVELEAIAGPEHDEGDGLTAGLNEALTALPERQRTAFFLREWRGLPSREVAARLGLKSGETYALLTRARQSMAAALTTSVGRAGLAGHLVTLLAKLKGLCVGGAAKIVAATTVVAAVAAGAGVAVEQSRIGDRDPEPRAGAVASDTRRTDGVITRATSATPEPAPAEKRPGSPTAVRDASTRARHTLPRNAAAATPGADQGLASFGPSVPETGSDGSPEPDPATPEGTSAPSVHDRPATLPAVPLPAVRVKKPELAVPRPPLPIDVPDVVPPLAPVDATVPVDEVLADTELPPTPPLPPPPPLP